MNDSAVARAPKVFISYAWAGPLKKEWIHELARRLLESGVEVVLDEYDLAPGNDLFAYMERITTDPTITNVLMICDEVYKRKADARQGGVAVEAQIITPELYGRVTQSKFIPILQEVLADGSAPVPTYAKMLHYIDMSSPQSYEENFQKLLRVLWNRPQRPRPPLGPPPAFVTDDSAGSTVTHHCVVRIRQALDRDDVRALKKELPAYADGLVEVVRDLRVPRPRTGEHDEEIWQRISASKPYRDEWVDLLDQLCRSFPDVSTLPFSVGSLFERLIAQCDMQESGSWSEAEFEAPRFVTRELFLCLIAVLVRHAREHDVEFVLRDRYLVHDSTSSKERDFTAFDYAFRFLDEHRNRRLGLNCVRLSADLLKERCGENRLRFVELQTADFLLFVRSRFDGAYHGWEPTTLVHMSRFGRPLDLFRGASSPRRFGVLRGALTVSSLDELKRKSLKAFAPDRRTISFGPGTFGALSVVRLMALDELFPEEFRQQQ